MALNATKEKKYIYCYITCGKIRILAGVILGIGRAIGETMAVIMVAGNQARMPSSILKCQNFDFKYRNRNGLCGRFTREVLIATGVVLFVFILLINISFSIIKGRNKEKVARSTIFCSGSTLVQHHELQSSTVNNFAVALNLERFKVEQ